MSDTQRTLVVLKPDTIWRSIVWEVISRFERAGLHIAAIKMVNPDRDFLYHHYENIWKMVSRYNQKIFDLTVEMMTKTPVIAMVIEWIEVVEFVRKIAWPTEPKVAPAGTIRWDYAHISRDYCNNIKDMWLPNLLHASWNAEEAELEIAHRFDKKEIFDYEPGHVKFTR
jgi:nucleoside-diphosphate kinase